MVELHKQEMAEMKKSMDALGLKIWSSEWNCDW
jgi:hypothetical protein